MKQLKNLFDEKLLKFILVGVVNTLVGMAGTLRGTRVDIYGIRQIGRAHV